MNLQAWQPQESMLQDTILVLKQRQGASLAQIRKRLEVKNSDGKINEVKDKMLTSTLKGLVLKGTVEKTGGIYKLVRGISVNGIAEIEVPSRRHRRRRALTRGAIGKHRRRRKGHRHKQRHSRRRRRHHSRRRHHKRRQHHGRRKV